MTGSTINCNLYLIHIYFNCFDFLSMPCYLQSVDAGKDEERVTQENGNRNKTVSRPALSRWGWWILQAIGCR